MITLHVEVINVFVLFIITNEHTIQIKEEHYYIAC